MDAAWSIVIEWFEFRDAPFDTDFTPRGSTEGRFFVFGTRRRWGGRHDRYDISSGKRATGRPCSVREQPLLPTPAQKKKQTKKEKPNKTSSVRFQLTLVSCWWASLCTPTRLDLWTRWNLRNGEERQKTTRRNRRKEEKETNNLGSSPTNRGADDDVSNLAHRCDNFVCLPDGRRRHRLFIQKPCLSSHFHSIRFGKKMRRTAAAP